jgi:hypothetical protein
MLARIGPQLCHAKTSFVSSQTDWAVNLAQVGHEVADWRLSRRCRHDDRHSRSLYIHRLPKMILALQDDGVLRVYESVEEAVGDVEALDAEDWT